MDHRCPLKLKSLPTSPCPKAIEAIQRLRNGLDAKPGCEWYSSDASSCFCFFKWLAENGGRAIPDSQIAQLEMISDSEVKKIVQKFRKRADEFSDLKED